MIFYNDNVKKSVAKGFIPKNIFRRINNAFIAIDTTNDLGLFDVKKLKTSEQRIYYRLSKGKYRAIFYIEDGNFFVIAIAKREEVYNRWE